MASIRVAETITEATASYEAWLRQRLELVDADLVRKHTNMAADEFAFFRATYYRWAQTWPQQCPELANAPTVLAVGDLHIENFGTWRDVDGRLVWGINDFDEAFTLPYTNDLVRLATSVLFAYRGARLAIGPKSACAAILAGYRRGLHSSGRPFVLAEQHVWLSRLAVARERALARFWKRLTRAAAVDTVADSVRDMLRAALPDDSVPFEIRPRIAGEGSLGHARWVAVADWRGARVAREAKARAPSASVWVRGDVDSADGDGYAEIITQAIRSPDPALRVEPAWIIRRLAPDCSRVELSSLPGRKLEQELLEAMGYETANIHLGTPESRGALIDDLQRHDPAWLLRAGRAMLNVMLADWKAFRRRQQVTTKR